MTPALLIDRPASGRVGSDALALGAWVFCDGTVPGGLPKDRVARPYAEPEDVLAASVKALRDADDAMGPVCAAIEASTGVDALGDRFWQVYLFKWLAHVCGTLEDIRLRCAALQDSEAVLAPSAGEADSPPQDFPGYFRLVLGRTGSRHALVTAAIRRWRGGPEGAPILYATNTPPRPVAGPRGTREAITLLASRFWPGNGTATLFADRYHVSAGEFGSWAAKGSLFPILPPTDSPPAAPDLPARQAAFQAFPEPLKTALTALLPTSMLEALPGTLDQARRLAASFPNVTKVVTFGQAWSLPGVSRATVAFLADRGAKIASVQHGAGYGTYLASLNAGVEYKLADEFVSWGWSQDDGTTYGEGRKIVPRPSHYLSRLAARRPGPARWKFLAICFSEDIVPRWLYSPVFPELALEYFRRQRQMFAGLSRLGTLAVKVPPTDHGWGHVAAMRAEHLAAEFITTPSFPMASLSAGIAVVDYSGTGFLEVLAMDRPLLASWDRRWWRGPASFERHLDELRAVGVFHDEVPSLLEAAETASRDPEAWWAAPARREAVARMRHRFARTSPTSLETFRTFAAGAAI